MSERYRRSYSYSRKKYLATLGIGHSLEAVHARRAIHQARIKIIDVENEELGLTRIGKNSQQQAGRNALNLMQNKPIEIAPLLPTPAIPLEASQPLLRNWINNTLKWMNNKLS